MNLYLFQLINSWASQNAWLDRFMVFSAEWLGYLLILGVILCYLKDRQKYKDMALVAFSSAIVARFIFVEIIRSFYYSPRPFLVLQNVHQLLAHDLEASFPSGHASFYFALAGGVYLYNKKAGYAYFVLAGLMGFARIFGGVHWAFDILVGAVLGMTTTWLVNLMKEKMSRRTLVG